MFFLFKASSIFNWSTLVFHKTGVSLTKPAKKTETGPVCDASNERMQNLFQVHIFFGGSFDEWGLHYVLRAFTPALFLQAVILLKMISGQQ